MGDVPSLDDLQTILDKLETTPACDLESEVLEFKRWVSDVKENWRTAVEQVSGFANAIRGIGGVVLFGVDDKTGAITGCESADLDKLRMYVFDNTRPSMTVQVSELGRPEGKLVVVTVDEDALPENPLTCVGNTGGQYWIRVGKQTCPLIQSDWKGRRKRVAASRGSEAAAAEWAGESWPPSDWIDGDAARLALEQERDELVKKVELLQAAGTDGWLAREGLRLTQVEHEIEGLSHGYRKLGPELDFPPDCFHWVKIELARLDEGKWRLEDIDGDVPVSVLEALDAAMGMDIFSRFEVWGLYEWGDLDEDGNSVCHGVDLHYLVGHTTRDERYEITTW